MMKAKKTSNVQRSTSNVERRKTLARELREIIIALVPLRRRLIKVEREITALNNSEAWKKGGAK